jgi:hypothetical protein
MAGGVEAKAAYAATIKFYRASGIPALTSG